MTNTRSIAVAVLSVLTFGLVMVGAPESARGATLTPISGAGSTWSANAIDQWKRNVNQFGLRVNFQATGSSDGRNQFRNNTVDFAVSEIPYGITDNGVTDSPGSRKFAYMPIVAGGTAFMYNLKAGGKRITNLRLSGENLTKIFTGVITTWNHPLLTAENPGVALPARPIVPVVRSDGSGTTAQFTLWMSKQFPALWNDYCKRNGRNQNPCGQTSSYPSKSPFLSLAGSLGVAGYVSQDKNEGTITYVEESYALNTGFPVVKLLNKAGYYVAPTAESAAVALQGARINKDKDSPLYLTQQLDGTYNHPDKRAYPLSSYSYMIVPTALEGPINADKGYSISRFAKYFLCDGQAEAPRLGYSPLTRNLVEAALDVVNQIPGHDPASVDITKCRNPTFSSTGENLLAKHAPFPSECDKLGSPAQCTGPTGGAKEPTPPKAGAPNPGSGGGAGGGGGGGAGGPTPVPGSTLAPGATPLPGSAPPPGSSPVPGTTDTTTCPVDPETGQSACSPGQTGTPGTTGTTGDAAPVALGLKGGTGNGYNGALVVFAVVLLTGLVVGPPIAARRIAAQQRSQE